MISLKSFLFVLQSWYWCNFCSGKYHVQFSASSSGISNLIETWIKHLFRLPTYCIMYIARSKLLNRAITFPHPVTRTLPSTWTLYRVNPQLLSFLLTTKLLVNPHHHCLQIFSIEYPAFPPPPSPSCAPLTLLLVGSMFQFNRYYNKRPLLLVIDLIQRFRPQGALSLDLSPVNLI